MAVNRTNEVPISKWEDFDIGAGLGTGKFGRVFLAKTRKEGFICALKILFKKQISQSHLEHQFFREVDIMAHLDHPNVLKLYTFFHDQRMIVLVLEFALHGNMYTHLMKRGFFSEHISADYTYQLCEALRYIHSKNVIHRDIKPENLLIGYPNVLKLADFGWSVHTHKMRRKTRCGTIDYLPPEMVKHEEYDASVDIWCTGILLYEMLCGRPPFEDEEENRTFERIKTLEFKFDPKHKEQARDLIKKILRLSSRNRMTLKDIQNHDWIKHYRALN